MNNRYHNAGVLVTGCQSHETSADCRPGNDPSKAYGALTHTLVTAVRKFKELHPDESVGHRYYLYYESDSHCGWGGGVMFLHVQFRRLGLTGNSRRTHPIAASFFLLNGTQIEVL